MKNFVLLMLLVGVIVFGGTAQADTIVLSPTQDARILSFYDADYTDGTSTGREGGIWLSTWTTTNDNSFGGIGGSNNQRSLLQFDLSTVPTGSSITSATLTLHGGWMGGSNSQAMEIYRLTSLWAEPAVTWAHRTAAMDWNTLGGDYVGTSDMPDVNPYATTGNVSYPFDATVSWDVTGLTTEWYSHAQDNNGLLIRSYPGSSMVFHSREGGGQNLGPRLTIYTEGDLPPPPSGGEVPEPSTLVLFASLSLCGIAAAAWKQRRKEGAK